MFSLSTPLSYSSKNFNSNYSTSKKASFIFDKSLLKSLNKFSLQILNDLSKLNQNHNSNIVFSPLSLQIELNLLLLSLRGGSLNHDVIKYLGFDSFSVNQNSIHDNYQKLLRYLYCNNKNKNITFKYNNIVLINNDLLRVKESYINEIQLKYGAKVYNFSKELNNPIDDVINDYIKCETDNLIKHLLLIDNSQETTNVNNVDTCFCLLNVALFKGIWLYNFERDLLKKEFKNYNGKKSFIEYMKLIRKLDYCQYQFNENIEIKAVRLPYKGNLFQMVILLPIQNNNNENNIIDFVCNELKENHLLAIYESFEAKNIELRLPSFKIESNIDILGLIKDQIESLSKSNIFEKITDSLMKIDKIMHTAIVDVEEFGTKSVMNQADKQNTNLNFTVNKPFIYIIKESTTQVPLFMGRVDKII